MWQAEAHGVIAEAGKALWPEGVDVGAPSLVYVVDDDQRVRDALGRLLRANGFSVKVYETGDEFLAEDLSQGPACVLLDMRLPHSNGLDVQQTLAAKGRDLPIIFITGHGTIAMTVRAIKAGAVEFLTKPCSEQELLAAVRSALVRDEAALQRLDEQASLVGRYEGLTPREREVMSLAIGGLMNKQMAASLGTSEINVKVHKRHVMQKMQARSLPDLVLMAERLHVTRTLSR